MKPFLPGITLLWRVNVAQHDVQISVVHDCVTALRGRYNDKSASFLIALRLLLDLLIPQAIKHSTTSTSTNLYPFSPIKLHHGVVKEDLQREVRDVGAVHGGCLPPLVHQGQQDQLRRET